jgi:hypothetical protein
VGSSSSRISGSKRQRTRQAHALLHSAGDIGRHLIEIAVHAHLGQQLPYPVGPLGPGHVSAMVFKGKRHVLRDSERIVERRLLKQETHLLSDFAHAIESQAGNVLAMDANRS